MTIASFSNNEFLVRKFEKSFQGKLVTSVIKSIIFGLFIGLSYLLYETVYTVIYISLGELLKKNKDLSEIQNHYVAIYAIFFGTYAIAQSGAFAPSSSKANSAYKKIFEVIDNTISNDKSTVK